MPDCNYCAKSYDDENTYLDHLREEHIDELGPIDHRRISTPDDEGEIPVFPIVAGLLLLTLGTVVAYVLFFMNGSNSATATTGQLPSNMGSAHYHGSMTMIADGRQVKFSQSKYQHQADAFHFEGGNGRQWHVHAQEVSLKYAMSTLGINVSSNRVSFAGKSYGGGTPGTNATVRVNGEPVMAGEYVLQEGDSIYIGLK